MGAMLTGQTEETKSSERFQDVDETLYASAVNQVIGNAMGFYPSANK